MPDALPDTTLCIYPCLEQAQRVHVLVIPWLYALLINRKQLIMYFQSRTNLALIFVLTITDFTVLVPADLPMATQVIFLILFYLSLHNLFFLPLFFVIFLLFVLKPLVLSRFPCFHFGCFGIKVDRKSLEKILI